MDSFIKINAIYEDDSAEVLERVIGLDIFIQDQDRPFCFISRCGKVCGPRRPTSDGCLHEHDTRKY